MLEPTGLISDLQRCSLHDGPGIRSTVFLKGCPLRCLWCQNPETQRFQPEVMLDNARCQRCGLCVDACADGRHVVDGEQDSHRLRPEVSCHGCLSCAGACPYDALEVSGCVRTVGEVMSLLARDEPYYLHSGGGITLSGGEPLYQTEFTLALLAAAKKRGWHTAIDTCGYAHPDDLVAALALSDLVLFDLKETDPALHRAWTGVPLAPILDSLERVAASSAELWVRLPVVPPLNDRDDHWLATAVVLRRLPVAPQVHLIPYHPLGEAKRRALGREDDDADGLTPPTAERLEEIAGLLETAGVPVILPDGRRHEPAHPAD